jgi:hypothetical protein
MSEVEKRLKEFREKKEREKRSGKQRDQVWSWITFQGIRNRWARPAPAAAAAQDENRSRAEEQVRYTMVLVSWTVP